tara:strand:+ start:123 stop:491 length:369 start_codon:yes stop_codon:yes gene_type:complete
VKNTSFLVIFIIVFGISCQKKKIVRDPMDNPSDYLEVPGVVSQTRDYFDWRYLERSRDVFYEFTLGQDSVYKGEIKHTTLFGIRKNDRISIVVNKKDPSESYFNGPGMLLDTIMEFYRYGNK